MTKTILSSSLYRVGLVDNVYLHLRSAFHDMADDSIETATTMPLYNELKATTKVPSTYDHTHPHTPTMVLRDRDEGGLLI